MDRCRITYRDATEDVGVDSRVNHAPELRDALIALGFRRVGLLETRLGDSLTAELLGQFLAGSDADLVLKVIAEGDVVEILTSPDQSAFAVTERWFGGPVVCLYTLVEEGIIVETTMRPARPPRPNQPAAQWLMFRADGVAGWLVTLLMNAVLGTPPLWVHENWPHSGYHLTLVDTRDVQVLWREHRRQVDRMAHRDGVRLRPHRTLPLYLCIRHRARQIAQQKARWQERFSRGITLLFLALVVATVLSAGHLFAHLSAFGSLALFVPLAFMLLAGSLAILFIVFARGVIVPRLPGPKVQPVRHLLAEVEAAYPLGGQAA